MNKILSVVVDDEASCRENLSMLLGQFCPNIDLLGSATSLSEASELIKKQHPELVFLDVQLGAHTAFELLKKLSSVDFEIIFVTAHDHYALKAFEFMAVDYLLKPIEISQLIRAVNNATERINSKSRQFSLEQVMMQVENLNRSQHKIALATSKGYEMIYICNIMYCLANGSYTKFIFKAGDPQLVSKNLKYYENILQSYGFVRSHNSALVNLQYVKMIDRTQGGSLIMEDGETVPLSKTVRQHLEERIKDIQRLI